MTRIWFYVYKIQGCQLVDLLGDHLLVLPSSNVDGFLLIDSELTDQIFANIEVMLHAVATNKGTYVD